MDFTDFTAKQIQSVLDKKEGAGDWEHVYKLIRYEMALELLNKGDLLIRKAPKIEPLNSPEKNEDTKELFEYYLSKYEQILEDYGLNWSSWDMKNGLFHVVLSEKVGSFHFKGEGGNWGETFKNAIENFIERNKKMNYQKKLLEFAYQYAIEIEDFENAKKLKETVS